ncbi:hypothetical protein QYF36_019843 [Acer negundo]|nr:hypothetical protein QYF36_019843 [Acer negundo]
MNGVSVTNPESDCSDFVEVDPAGRYGRYNEILGKEASKTVPEELERLYCEIHLLKTLKQKNIMKFYTSWVDTAKRNINFVTEMFTFGTLRQDLKCDNTFVNGNQGEVKIGDLGLAAILCNSHAACCVDLPLHRQPLYGIHHSNSSLSNGYGNYIDYDPENNLDFFTCEEDEHFADFNLSIKGKRREDDDIFLRLRIADREDIIDGEIAALVPKWKRESCIDESTRPSTCHYCGSNEITYQVDGTEQCAIEVKAAASRKSDVNQYTDIWAQREPEELSCQGTRDINCDEVHETLKESNFAKEERIISMDSQSESDARNSFSKNSLLDCDLSDDYENEIRQELRWLKAKYSGALLPHFLHRASSLPVDVVDVQSL